MFQKTFSPMRLALATALFGLVALGISYYQMAVDLSSERLQASTAISRLQEELGRQQPSVTGSRVNSIAQTQSAPTTPKPAAPSRSPGKESPIAYLTLDSGMTRGPGQFRRIALSPDTEIVKFTLRLADIPQTSIQEQLLTPEQNRIWSQTVEPSALEVRNGALLVFVPSYLLKPNDYQIVINRETPDGVDRLATYVFRVAR